MKSIFSHLLVGIASAVVCFFLFRHFFPPQMIIRVEETPAARLVADPFPSASPVGQAIQPIDFKEISHQATQAVVNIITRGATGYRLASGSGVIISPDGYIITNHHVIEDGTTVEVTLHNRRRYEAQVAGVDPLTDLALLKIEASNLSVLTFGDSDKLNVGEWVLAVGNPFNLSSTVTAGIVSAKARNINILSGAYAIESFIQTDAAVNPGNSGGALINTLGELVGINTAIISESGYAEGYSFAIPSTLVRKIIADLLEFGEAKRAVLGVKIVDVTEEIAREMDLPDVEGVLIREVSEGSSAGKSGLKPGDVIISINGFATPSVPELQEQVARYRPGDRISLDYFRNGKRLRQDDVLLYPLEPVISRDRE